MHILKLDDLSIHSCVASSSAVFMSTPPSVGSLFWTHSHWMVCTASTHIRMDERRMMTHGLSPIVLDHGRFILAGIPVQYASPDYGVLLGLTHLL